MARINCRTKGANGEREFIKWAQSILDLNEEAKRNLEQTRNGGADIYVDCFAFEVKRVEALDFRKWWMQAKRQAGTDYIPVVVYRQNKQPWRILISAENVGLDYGYIALGAREAVKWLQKTHEAWLFGKF